MDKIILQASSSTLVSSVSKFVENFCQSHAIHSEILNNLLLVVDEVVSNIKKYSHTNNEPVTVTCTLNSDSVKEIALEISDDGIPFDPLSQEEPDLDIPTEDREIGGLGILLIKSLTSQQQYFRKNNTNILKLKFTV